ncbi:hypothetical protein [Nonomuraea jabiensis]|uniref:Uncharacterized protein n=1 Tax=Nonomuraea jabiensis TaxID=882448 RepID=A0A7W9GG57_9ACTN|nr:hypothetical protein [Nonomuraea jabiensis]MBB5783142.1 hypothetical protein [Nonomuraea jabiensis]
MRIARWPKERGRDSPYAHSTVTTMETAVPASATTMLTSSE